MDTEDPSGYTITDADRRFAHDLGFVAPKVLPLHVARFRTRCLELDRKQRQPTSPPDRLPVPGAAVRALVGEWRRRAASHQSAQLSCADELEAALRADSAAAGPVPTREELAVMLASDANPGGDPREQWLHAADVALAVLARRPAVEMPRFQVTEQDWRDAIAITPSGSSCFEALNVVLARRPATEVVRPAMCTLEQAQRIIAAVDGRVRTPEAARMRAVQLRDAVNAELRPATDEAEALPRPDRKEVTHALILTFQRASKELRAPDYEAPWFAVADEAIKLCAPGVAGDPLWKRVEGLHAERNTLHALVADLESQLASVTRERDGWRNAAENQNRQWSAKCEEAAETRARAETAERERDEALAKLAARPEPVVIDEALARRAAQAYTDVHGDDPKPMLYALRKVFGDHASVSVPLGEMKAPQFTLGDYTICPRERDWCAWETESADEGHIVWGSLQEVVDYVSAAMREDFGERDQLRAELAKATADSDLRSAQMLAISSALNGDDKGERREHGRWTPALDEARKLRAELEKTRAALESTQGELEDALGNRDLQQLGAELADYKSRLEGYQRTDRELRDKWNAELKEVGRLGRELEKARAEHQATAAEFRAYIEKSDAELEKTRAELEHCRDSKDARINELGNQLIDLREQHEALRAECVPSRRELVLVDELRADCEHMGRTEDALLAYFDRVQAALLKPAPAEPRDACVLLDVPAGIANPATAAKYRQAAEPAPAQYHPNDLDDVDGDVSQLDEPGQHPPPESAMVEPNEALQQAVRMAEREVHVPERYRTEGVLASLQPLTARVDTLESTLRTFLTDWARGSFNKARAAEVLEALDARKGGGA